MQAPVVLPTLTEELREVALFGALPDEALEFLATQMVPRQLTMGQALFREGEPGREVFIVRSGTIDLSLDNGHGQDVVVATAGPGDWVGLVSVIDIQPRHNTAIALEPTTVLGLGSATLDALYRRDPRSYALLVLNMARELSRRVRIADVLVVRR